MAGKVRVRKRRALRILNSFYRSHSWNLLPFLRPRLVDFDKSAASSDR